jgi:hypothetical protein
MFVFGYLVFGIGHWALGILVFWYFGIRVIIVQFIHNIIQHLIASSTDKSILCGIVKIIS